MTHRIHRVRALLDRHGCDGFFSIHPPDNQYLSGFLTSFDEVSTAILITKNEALLLTDSRYTEQAESEAVDFTVEQIKRDLVATAAKRLNDLGAARVLLDPKGLTHAEFNAFTNAREGQATLVKDLLVDLRMVKEPEEIEIIHAAGALADGVHRDALHQLTKGVSEAEVAAWIEYEFKKRGATGTSFDTTVLFGENSSRPHGVSGDRRLKPGDVILIDMGCRYRGYCSDLTRTYAFNKIPGAWFEEIYALTREAQEQAIAAVRPGATGKDVDAVARTRIDDGGFGDRFGHGLGHGVGIEIHEKPSLNPRSDTVLEPGMVVTVEPGIYLPGQGGVRIEDLVVVTESGYDLLTHLPKDLNVV